MPFKKHIMYYKNVIDPSHFFYSKMEHPKTLLQVQAGKKSSLV